MFLFLLQIYKGKNWSLAEDHIQFTIGRLASSLQLQVEATESFANLITATSRQSAQQQAVFLKEYLIAHQVSNFFFMFIITILCDF